MKSIRTYITNILMLQTPTKTPDINSVTWTLFLEWIIYAVASSKVTWFKSVSGTRIWSVFLSASFVLGVIVPFLLHKRVPAGAFACLLSAMSGYVIYLYVREQISRAQAWTFIAVNIAVTTVIAYVNYELLGDSATNPLQPGALPATLSLLGGYALFYAIYKLRERRFPNFFLWTGKISYSLYLTHAIAIVLTQGIWNSGKDSFIRAALIVTLQFAGSFLLGWIGYQYVEKPALEIGKRFIARQFNREDPKPIPDTAA